MEYIFICYAGVNRSPIAVDVAKTLARKYGIKDFKTEFLGIANVDYLNLDSFRKRLNQANIIFALDNEIVDELVRKGISLRKVCNLEIEDCYPVREHPKLRGELERILTFKLEPFFKQHRESL